MPIDPHKRIVDATVLNPARSIGGVSHSIALLARPVGADRDATVTTATVEGSESGDPGEVEVWFKRGVQQSVVRVVWGEGDAQDVPQYHAMGGNVCACPEPMNLQFHNNDRALIGGDYAGRARPWDVVELNYAGGKRRFLISEVAAFGKAPDEVNYAPSSAITKVQDFGPLGGLDLATHFLWPLYPDEELFIDPDSLTGDMATLYSGMQVKYFHPGSGLYVDSARAMFKADGTPVVAPYTDGVEEYLPDDADFAGSTSRYWWDTARNVLRFSDKTRALGAAGVTVTGWRRSAETGKAYSYIWPGDGETVFDLAIEGAGTGLASTGGDHRVARAVEAWGEDTFVARLKFEQVIADSGFGKAGLCVSNGVRPGAKQVIVDWYGGTPRVYTIDDDGTVTHEATWAAPASATNFDISIARSDEAEWTIVDYSSGSSVVVATVNFDLGTESPLVGPYAAEDSKLRWFQYEGTLGASREYIHTRDSLTADQTSYIAQRVAGVDLAFDFSRRRELLLVGSLIDTVVNVTTGEEMTTVFDNNPTTRNEYGVEAGATASDPPILILPLESDGDVFRVTYTPEDPPDAPGQYPPAQGRLNFSTDGGTVNQNRANWFDKVTILDPAGKWPSGSAADDATVTIRRDPVWQSIDTVEYATYSASGSPSWTEIDSDDYTAFVVDGFVFLKTSWVAANLSSSLRYSFRITGTEFQRTGGFDAESYRLAMESFEAIEDGWISGAASFGGAAGPSYLISAVDYELGSTGFDLVGGNPATTGLAFGSKSELLHLADPEIDDSSLASCGTPSRTLDPGDWSRARWPSTVPVGGGTGGVYWIGASEAGLDADSILGGLACSHDITLPEALVYQVNTNPDVGVTTRGFGSFLSGAGPGPDQISANLWIDGVKVILGDDIRGLPEGSTCVKAWAEVVIPSDCTVFTERFIYHGPARVPAIGTFGYEQYFNGGLIAEYWETWNGSTWVVTTPAATYAAPDPPSSFSLGFQLMGTRKHTLAVAVPEKGGAAGTYLNVPGDEYVSLGASLPATVNANGKRQLVDVTAIIQAMLDDRDSANDPNGYFMWPHAGSVPDAETVASEGTWFGLLRSMLPSDGSITDFARTASGAHGAKIDTGVCTYVEMPTEFSFGEILARFQTPSGTIATMSVPSPIPALVVE